MYRNSCEITKIDLAVLDSTAAGLKLSGISASYSFKSNNSLARNCQQNARAGIDTRRDR
jgi:hypothetical protein